MADMYYILLLGYRPFVRNDKTIFDYLFDFPYPTTGVTIVMCSSKTAYAGIRLTVRVFFYFLPTRR